MIDVNKFEKVEVASAAALDAWLETHHSRAESVWLVTWLKAAGGQRHVGREAVLDSLVAWGWIDGVRRKLDAEKTMQLISPRRQQIWAQSYKDRAARLEAEGRMREPGRHAIEASKRAGLWSAFAEVDALIVPEDVAGALSARAATSRFAALAPSYRRNVLRWIAGAKRAETRAKRIEDLVARTARGEKVPQF